MQEPDYKTLFESTPGLYLVLLPDLTIVAISDAYANVTMTKREEITGRYLFDAFPANPKNAPVNAVLNTTASINFVLKNKTSHTMPVQRHDIRRPDGTFEERYWGSVNKPVLNAKNEVIYIILRVEDVTSFIQLQKELSGKDKITIDLKSQLLEMASALISANKELAFQNSEKEKHVAELIVANNELIKSEGIIKKLNQELELKVIERTAELENVHKDILDYKYALDAADIVAVTNSKGTILHVNENFCQISKYTGQELIGQDHRIVSSGYHSKEFISNLWVTIVNGKIWKGEMCNKAKDGSIFWVDTTIVPFVNEFGKPFKYLAIRSDITKRKQSLEALKASEEKYRNIYENTLVALFTFDMKALKTIEVNEVGVQLYGYKSRKDFLDHFDPAFHVVNIGEREDNILHLKEKGKIENRIHEMRKLDGTHFWGKLFAKTNSDKSLVQSVIIDITPQVLLISALKASEEKYRNLFENSLAAICVLDMKKQKPVDVNEAGALLFGYQSKEHFLEKFNLLTHFVNLEDIETIAQTLKEKGTINDKVLELKKLDGTRFWTISYGKMNVENSLIQSIMFDITERKAARERILKLNEELESKVIERTLELTESLSREKELNEIQSSFVSTASHEFRTPLSTILSSLFLIELYTEAHQQEKRVVHINRIASSVKNLNDILNDFLTLEQLRKGAVIVENVPFNLHDFLGLIVDEMGVFLSKKNQQIKYDHTGDPMIEQSVKVLKNLLLNLLSNASKYSAEGKEILLTSTVFNNKVAISVTDQGIGIPEEDQGKLFKEFFRAKNAENIQGTGLGLSIVKRYVELLKGNIFLKSRVNEGTTFTVEFPQHNSNP